MSNSEFHSNAKAIVTDDRLCLRAERAGRQEGLRPQCRTPLDRRGPAAYEVKNERNHSEHKQDVNQEPCGVEHYEAAEPQQN
jgi:hypothetical protein